MGIAIELRKAISSIREKLGPTCRLNGVAPTVVEGWLTAVENHLACAPVDWSAIRICLNVLNCWIGRVHELRAASEIFRRVSTGGDRLTAAAVLPSEFERWLWAPKLSDQFVGSEILSGNPNAVTAFPPAVPQ